MLKGVVIYGQITQSRGKGVYLICLAERSEMLYSAEEKYVPFLYTPLQLPRDAHNSERFHETFIILKVPDYLKSTIKNVLKYET